MKALMELLEDNYKSQRAAYDGGYMRVLSDLIDQQIKLCGKLKEVMNGKGEE